jgi:hypothetical protein
MATRISGAAQNAAVDAVVDLVDIGTGANGTLAIYTGSQPADVDDAATGTKLVSIALSGTAFGAAASGSAALAGTPKSGTAIAAGTAGWFRIFDQDGETTGNGIIDGSVTATGGGGDLELDNTSIASSQTVNITALTVSIPASE